MPSYVAETETYFPDLGKTAAQGDTVTVDDDGVLVGITTPKAKSKTADVAPDAAPEES